MPVPTIPTIPTLGHRRSGVSSGAAAAPGAGGSIFASDSFTDTAATALTSHTGEVGATWAKPTGITGNAAISGLGAVYSSGAGTTAIHYASGVPTTAEYDVQATITQIATGATTTAVGLVGRLSTSANPGTDYHWTWASASGLWTLVERVAGTSTTLGSFADTWVTGVPKTIRLEIRTAAKKAFIDGVERASSATDVVTAAGRAGIWIHSSSGSNANAWQVDNFVATNV